METINSVANAATKAIWGDSEANKEPVSGVKGDVAKGEPFDAGNLENSDQDKVEGRLDNVGENAANTTKPAQSGTVHPDVDTSSAQNDTRHPDEVKDAPEEASIPQDKLKGPGPKPVAVLAKEHGGDAGKATVKDAVVPETETETKKEAPKAQEEDKKDAGHGEEVVKATGFKADGGNFDASKPGAGSEADRLLEHHISPSNPSTTEATTTTDKTTTSTTSPTPDTTTANGAKDSKHSKDKPSLSERIKAKLHRHKDSST